MTVTLALLLVSLALNAWTLRSMARNRRTMAEVRSGVERIRTQGAYVIRSAESRPRTVIPLARRGAGTAPTATDVDLAAAVRGRMVDR
jgi:hypothetical protein